jgi:hypothetical protein
MSIPDLKNSPLDSRPELIRISSILTDVVRKSEEKGMNRAIAKKYQRASSDYRA